MSNSVKTILALGLVTFIAACAQQEEEYVVVEPVVEEAPATSKYK